MGLLAAATLDICKAGLINVIDYHATTRDFKRHPVQYTMTLKTMKMQFDGELFIWKKLPKLEGRLTVFPYIGDNLDPRHYDVTATVTKEAEKVIEAGEPFNGKVTMLKTWFNFNFTQVFNVANPPYAKVIEWGEDDE